MNESAINAKLASILTLDMSGKIIFASMML